MRTLDPALQTALNGDFEPYILLQYAYDDSFDWTDAPYAITKSILGGLQWEIETFGSTDFPWYAVRLRRGAIINGTPNYLQSSIYYVNETSLDQNERVKIKASIVPKTGITFQIDGHQSYRTIIQAICTQFGYTASFENPTAPFWDYIFYPAGRNLKLQSPFTIFNLLQKKLFIYACDNNANEIYFRQWLDDSQVGTLTHPAIETITTFDWVKKYDLKQKLLLWRDENNTIHTWPGDDLPIHNMGYLESTAAIPYMYQSWNANADKRTFHLKYQDGDIIKTSSSNSGYQIQIFETFNAEASPSYYLQFKALPKFGDTEGGTMPSTIQAAAPYTPLNTSYFDRFLTNDVNNLQAFADFVNDYAMNENMVNTLITAAKSALYPVGSIYTSVLSTNPATLLGFGTWSAFGAGRVLVGIDPAQTEFNTVEETGGAKTHTLTTGEMPAHTHAQNPHNHTQDPHTHTQNSHAHTVNEKFAPVLGSSGFAAASTTGGTTNTPSTSATTATNQDTTATNQPSTATNQNTGGGAAHNNLQPYIVVYMWKRTA